MEAEERDAETPPRPGTTGDVAVVTGGVSGIGAAIAETLALRGYRIATCDLDRESIDRQRCEHGFLSRVCDVSDAAAVTRFAEEVLHDLGPPAVLVNNAARVLRKPLAELSVAEWDDVFAVNLRGALLCTQAFGRPMVEQGQGSVVNIGSIAGTVTTEPGLAAYAASKAGLVLLTRSVAIEWGPLGVRCNCVSPGFVRTPATERAYRTEGVLEQRQAAVPLGTIADAPAIAEVVAFLASPEAGYINGETVVVDGGLSHNLFAQVPGRDALGASGQV